MLVIPCPWCGDRHESEFVCAGEARPPRPADPASCGAEDWTAYLLERRNTRGPATEVWWHAKGCGLWFSLLRDTVTHEVRSLAEESGE